uniref:Uncharacterized protein n=1 Tax=Rhizophora mucronata TaxID=61149 RepID=A0A2P2MJ20_RHIMU
MMILILIQIGPRATLHSTIGGIWSSLGRARREEENFVIRKSQTLSKRKARK